jgi:hypothetical protein
MNQRAEIQSGIQPDNILPLCVRSPAATGPASEPIRGNRIPACPPSWLNLKTRR